MKITKHPEFRVVHSNGVFGGLNPNEGDITFYTDIAIPKCKTGGPFGALEIDNINDNINRELQVNIRMSIQEFIRLSNWMSTKVRSWKNKAFSKKKI